MACFIVPAAEAVVTTIVTKVVKNQETQKVEAPQQIKGIKASQKLGWLNNMLWGGSFLLAFEHVWHGEVVPYFPFLTAAANKEATITMLQEMGTVGVSMALAVTGIWILMVAVTASWEKNQERICELDKHQIN